MNEASQAERPAAARWAARRPRILTALWESPRTLKVSGAFALAIVVLACIAPLVAPADPYATDYATALQGPSARHWFGCDAMGRDVFSRVVYGARTSVLTTLVAVAAPLLIGCTIGFAAAWRGAWLDAVLMRIADMFQAFPEIILGVAIVGMLGAGLVNAVIAVIAVAWVRYARLTRSLVLSLKQSGFVETAYLNGASGVQVAVRHLLGHLAPHIISMAVLDIGYILLTLASFSFLGLGAQAPTAEWGAMLNDGRAYFASAPHLMAFPGLALFCTVLVFNLFGNALAHQAGGADQETPADRDQNAKPCHSARGQGTTEPPSPSASRERESLSATL